MSADPSISTAEAVLSPGSQDEGLINEKLLLQLKRDESVIACARIKDNVGGYMEVAVQFKGENDHTMVAACLEISRIKLDMNKRPVRGAHPEILAAITVEFAEVPEVYLQYEVTCDPITRIAIDRHIELAVGDEHRIRLHDLGNHDFTKTVDVELFQRKTPDRNNPVSDAAVHDEVLNYGIRAMHMRDAQPHM